MHHRNSRQHKLPDSTAVAENRIAGGVGEGTGAIPFPRPDQHRGLTMTQGAFAPGFKLGLHHKDLKICQAMAAQLGISIPLTDVTVTDYEQLMTKGMATRIFRRCIG